MDTQFKMFDEPDEEKKYSQGIEVPIYHPRGKKPHELELRDSTKAKRLIDKIKEANLPDLEEQFLIDAAQRHVVFNYEKIADYYCNANAEVQALMEESALVIIDFDKAIEHGYVQLCQDIKKQYMEADYNDAE